jgi:hypothetical protein
MKGDPNTNRNPRLIEVPNPFADGVLRLMEPTGDSVPSAEPCAASATLDGCQGDRIFR